MVTKTTNSPLPRSPVTVYSARLFVGTSLAVLVIVSCKNIKNNLKLRKVRIADCVERRHTFAILCVQISMKNL